MGAEELEEQCVVDFDLCLRKVMTATVEPDETRMCNLLDNELAQLPWNEEIISGSNQQRRVADTAQAFSGVIGEQRVNARAAAISCGVFRDALRRSKPTRSYSARLRNMNSLRNVQHVHALTDRKAVVSRRENCHVNVWVGEDVLESCHRARIFDQGHQHDLVVVPSGVTYERLGIVVSSAYRGANTPITFRIVEGSFCGLLDVFY